MVARSKRGGRQNGAENYSDDDVNALLRCINTILPRGGDDWKKVHKLYLKNHALPNQRSSREPSTLKNKFRFLLNESKPSGNPDCPLVVKKAHEIHRKIEEAVAFTEVDDSCRSTRQSARIQPLPLMELADAREDNSGNDADDFDLSSENDVRDDAGSESDTSTALGSPPRSRQQVFTPGDFVPSARESCAAITLAPPPPPKRPGKQARGKSKQPVPAPPSSPPAPNIATSIQKHLAAQARHRDVTTSERHQYIQQQELNQQNQAHAALIDRLERKIQALESQNMKLFEQKETVVEQRDQVRERLMVCEMDKHKLVMENAKLESVINSRLATNDLYSGLQYRGKYNRDPIVDRSVWDRGSQEQSQRMPPHYQPYQVSSGRRVYRPRATAPQPEVDLDANHEWYAGEDDESKRPDLDSSVIVPLATASTDVNV